MLLEIIFHQSVAIGHDAGGGASLRTAPVPSSLLLVLVEQAARATAAEKHEDQEDEHNGGQHDANDAANAGGTKLHSVNSKAL